MAKSPIAIERYYLSKLRLVLKEEFENGEAEVDLNGEAGPHFGVAVETGQSENDLDLWRVSITVNGGEEDEGFPYSFEIGYVGFFRLAAELADDQKQLIATVNGPSILFAAAREFLAIATARTPFAPIMLPSMSFVPNQDWGDKPKSLSARKKTPTRRKSAKK